MSEKKGKKRSKAYYIKCAHGGKKAKHANDLDVGMAGFLVTCNKYERETVREMYNLLNEYADQLYGSEKPEKAEDGESDSAEEDMEKAMQKEAAEIKSTKQNVRRFQNTDTKTKNLIFIRTTLENPCELAHVMFTDIFKSQVQKARYALRMLPISVTCKANVNQISEAARTLFKRDFETAFGVGLKFTSICKIRNNNSVSRTAILPCLGRIIQELNPLHTLCHDEPDVVIIVEVIRNVCCLSVVKDYFKFKKYNLHEIISKTDNKDQTCPEKVKEASTEAETNKVPAIELTETVLDIETKAQEVSKTSNIDPKIDITKATTENETNEVHVPMELNSDPNSLTTAAPLEDEMKDAETMSDNANSSNIKDLESSGKPQDLINNDKNKSDERTESSELDKVENQACVLQQDIDSTEINTCNKSTTEDVKV